MYRGSGQPSNESMFNPVKSHDGRVQGYTTSAEVIRNPAVTFAMEYTRETTVADLVVSIKETLCSSPQWMTRALSDKVTLSRNNVYLCQNKNSRRFDLVSVGLPMLFMVS